MQTLWPVSSLLYGLKSCLNVTTLFLQRECTNIPYHLQCTGWITPFYDCFTPSQISPIACCPLAVCSEQVKWGDDFSTTQVSYIFSTLLNGVCFVLTRTSYITSYVQFKSCLKVTLNSHTDISYIIDSNSTRRTTGLLSLMSLPLLVTQQPRKLTDKCPFCVGTHKGSWTAFGVTDYGRDVREGRPEVDAWSVTAYIIISRVLFHRV